MLSIKKIAAAMAVILLLFWGVVFGEEPALRNPVECFRYIEHGRHGPVDTIMTGKMYFDPLPQYRKRSRIYVEYYNDKESDIGAGIHIMEYDKRYLLTPGLYSWPGPVHSGDTLRAEFDLIPLDVGNILLILQIYINKNYEYKGKNLSIMPTWAMRASMVLGVDGIAIGLGQEQIGPEYGTFLGPLPEIMADSLLFFWDPKLPSEQVRWFEDGNVKFRYFAIEEIIYTRPDDSGYYHVKCLVSPYHNFDGGIKFRVSPGGSIMYKNMSPNYDSPVCINDTLEFTFDFRLTAPGISRFAVTFGTPNPDAGKGPWSRGHGDERLSMSRNIYIGCDDNMELVFITNEDPFKNLYSQYPPAQRRVEKRLSIQKELDPRIEWLEKAAAISPLRPGYK